MTKKKSLKATKSNNSPTPLHTTNKITNDSKLNNMKTKEQIEEALILATSNPYNAENILDDSDAVIDIVNEFAEEWEDADCDGEDATPEQKEALDALLAKYTNQIYEVINKPHSIEYNHRDQRLEWYDANGYHFLSEFRPFTWWDVDVFNVLTEMGYSNEEADQLTKDIEDVLPFNLPSSDECFKLIESVLNGSKQINDLCNFCPVVCEDEIMELIKSGKDADAIYDEIIRMTEN